LRFIEIVQRRIIGASYRPRSRYPRRIRNITPWTENYIE